MKEEPTTLLELFRSQSKDKTALILPETDIRVSYSSLQCQAEKLARALALIGVRRGDRVGLALHNGLAAIVGVLAASDVATAAPLNPGYLEEEFRFYLEDTRASVLIVERDGSDEARRAAGDRIPVFTIAKDESGNLLLEGVSGGRSYESSSPEDIALILHTSGSTGLPKRAPLRHANLTFSACNIARTYQLTPEDVSFCVMPLFHVHGLVASALAPLSAGGTVIVPTTFHPLSFWRMAHQYGATWYSAVPSIHQLLVTRAHGSRPPGAEGLRFIRSCSAALTPKLMHDLEEAFGVPVIEAYGMTEAAHQMASNPLPPGLRKPGSVGLAAGVKISIMDNEGRHLPPNTNGEIAIQGPGLIQGYENNPEANAASFTQGWFRTGDEGYLDEQGYLTVVARKKELINRGGEKIAPRDIDVVLLAHPAVAEAVCFGISHPTWGEEVAAAVVLREKVSERDLLAYCRHHLSDYKRPRRIYITDEIPRTATGKIQRLAVAKSFSDPEAA